MAAERRVPGRATTADRIAAAVLLVGAVAAVLLLAVPGMSRYLPSCGFRWLTGFYCPGCGSGHAAQALLRLDLLGAWRANPLALLVAVPVAVGLARHMRWALLGGAAPGARVPAGWLWALLLAIVAFWILRNVPVWPFELLAPRY